MVRYHYLSSALHRLFMMIQVYPFSEPGKEHPSFRPPFLVPYLSPGPRSRDRKDWLWRFLACLRYITLWLLVLSDLFVVYQAEKEMS
jgi:hypothetical protein